MNRILILLAATAVSAIAVSSACFAAEDQLIADALSPRTAPQWAAIDLHLPFTAAEPRAWLQSSLL